MIVTKAPLRVSLMGGGSDLPSFYSNEFGQTLTISLKRYVYVTTHLNFFPEIILHYSIMERTKTIEEVKHPVVRNALKLFNFPDNIEVGSYADVPSNGTGLGSSSAFTNALILNLSKRKKLSIELEELAALSCEVEISMCKDLLGKQDQYASALGGINLLQFNSDDSVLVKKIDSDGQYSEFINDHFKLYYLGSGRNSASILNKVSNTMNSQSEVYESIRKIKELVPDSTSALINQDYKSLGELIFESWNLKKKTSPSIYSDVFEKLMKRAFELGATGGKVVGAGGGGFGLIVGSPKMFSKLDFEFRHLQNMSVNVAYEGANCVFNDED